SAERLGDLLVPGIADTCVIELADEAGARRVVCARPAGDAAAARLADHPLGPTPADPALVDPVPDGGRALRLAVGPSGRRFGPRDLRFAEVLADDVALALENAGLSAELEDAERRFRAIVDGMLDGVT